MLKHFAPSVILLAAVALAQGPPRPPRPATTQSPASRPRPKTATPQTYAADLIREGEGRFGALCGFCHGKDASGGESGPDLTRAEIVAEDVRGNKLAPMIRAGRPGQNMPAFANIGDAEMNALVAFMHTQMDKFATLGGARRTVEPEDLATGNAEAGRAYFNGAGKCASCHSPTGDLAGVAKRYQGLALIRRLLYPSGRFGAPQGKATFTLRDGGGTVVAPVIGEDEFSVTVLDPLGERKTYLKDAVKVTVDDSLAAHFDQLGKYTDKDMHNVYAYLETLK